MMLLDTIIAAKRRENKELRRHLYDMPIPSREGRNFLEALQGPGITLIAEVKKASPSRGVLSRDFNPEALASAYERGGASAVSAVTDRDFFQGHPDFVPAVKKACRRPVLRKDFIIDPVQVEESVLLGADALLLIAAVLEPDNLLELVELSLARGLEPLVEVHSREELKRVLDTPARVVGVNNRNLRDFSVDLNTSLQLAAFLPGRVTAVSESGIRHRQDMLLLEKAGFAAALAGEALVTAPDPETAVRSLLGRQPHGRG